MFEKSLNQPKPATKCHIVSQRLAIRAKNADVERFHCQHAAGAIA
jgi:hypothetical protein